MEIPLAPISDLYGLSLSFVEKVQSGFVSENYVLTNGTQQFFLKKHRHTDKSKVQGVCDSEQFFAEGGIPVILPLRSKEGFLFFEEGGGFYSLYPFVAGRHIERGTLTEQAAASLGSILGRLHKRGKESNLPIAEHYPAWNKEEFLLKSAKIEDEIAKEQPLSDFGALALKSLKLKRQFVEENTLTYEQLALKDDHLIHGDYFCDNVFFDAQDIVSYVFDFEKAQYAPPTTELFRSLFATFFSIPTEKNLQLARKCVDAYHAEYPLSKELMRDGCRAAYLKQLHSLWIEEEHYLKQSSRPDPILPSQFALNEYYFSNREYIEEYLLDNISI